MLTLHFSNSADPRFIADDFTPLLRQGESILPSIPETELELVLMTDQEIQVINRDSRGLNKPTDVLSFSYREERPEAGDPTADTEVNADAQVASPFLGQIFISIPAAQRNADQMGQSLEEELHFLFIHGFLHILGYDHHTKDEETEMMTIAYQILGRPAYQPD